ncbi:MAG TPA: bifunctional UDP-N-acetylglucosamine diphosphorylase/glucosamine-1-phosphate N-acetyltransferase GlmU [Firmicutes bacterium]|nr:bifunctional UDP-N-acetylglucosamine diphosphorylase/glucosamine-1-phosphate N-acetyltransferase GlmU [Bacillota bacterium]
MSGIAAIVLAAGLGTRMKSSMPKALHPVCGAPMIRHVLNALGGLEDPQIVIVVGHRGEEVRQALGSQYTYAHQAEQLGTGHAVLRAEEALRDFTGTVVVLYGDTPLLRQETVSKLVAEHKATGAVATVLTAKVDSPHGYGRILRDPAGDFVGIVEEKDATESQRLIDEINTGMYCFEKEDLFRSLQLISPKNQQGEYYLTDVFAHFQGKIHTVRLEDPTEAFGVNDRVQLAIAQKKLGQRIKEHWMREGVTIVDPDQTIIDVGVEIGLDTVIAPYTLLTGTTRIGANCVIGPFSRIQDAVIEDNVVVDSSVIVGSTIHRESTIGPFTHIRPGCHVGPHGKAGSYVELKNTRVGQNSKVPHLSYVGDTIIGEGVNIGAGTITCNYDGIQKHQTLIDDRSFVGSNTSLVAPVHIHEGAFVAAGSTITSDVPKEALAVGRARQRNIEGWVSRRKLRLAGSPGEEICKDKKGDVAKGGDKDL